MKVLLQKHPKAAHHEVEVVIDWEGISEEDLKFLAGQCLIHNLRAKVRAGFYPGELPEVIEIAARWEVHQRDPEVGHLLMNAPKSWKSGEDKVKVKVEKLTPAEEFEAMLKGLSQAEKDQLFATL